MWNTRAAKTVFPALLSASPWLGCGDAPLDGSDAPSVVEGRDGRRIYNARVVESTNVDQAIAGATVVLLNRETGAPVEEFVANSAGEVSLTIEGDDIGTLVETNSPLYTLTYNYGPPTSGLIRVGTASAAVAVPDLAGYQASDDATPVAGNVVWVNPATGHEEFVGCATVSGDGASNVSYFEGTLPTAPESRTSTQPHRGNNLQEAGKFFVGNLAAPGMRTLTAEVDGKVIGQVTIPAFPRRDAPLQDLGGTQGHANLTLVSIYADTPENPTPPDCD